MSEDDESPVRTRPLGHWRKDDPYPSVTGRRPEDTADTPPATEQQKEG